VVFAFFFGLKKVDMQIIGTSIKKILTSHIYFKGLREGDFRAVYRAVKKYY